MPVGSDLEFGIVIRADGSAAIRTLERTEDAVEDVGRGTDRASNSTRRYSDETDRAERASGRQVGTLGRLRTALLSVQGAIAALGLGVLVRNVARAGVQWQSLRSAMTAATGTAAAAARELGFVRAEANRLGLSQVALARSYTRLTAAARGTVLEGQASRDIFTAVAEASRVMGLTAEEAGGALTALEQIISKGVVSSEELRGQLGERLPGAFQIAARAMGVTTSELGEMLQRGEVLAEDLLPRLAVEIRRSVAEGLPDATDSAAAAFARLENSWEDLQRAIAESGVLDVLRRGAEIATGAIRSATPDDSGDERLAQLRAQAQAADNLVVALERLEAARAPGEELIRRFGVSTARTELLGALREELEGLARVAGRPVSPQIEVPDDLEGARALFERLREALVAARTEAERGPLEVTVNYDDSDVDLRSELETLADTELAVAEATAAREEALERARAALARNRASDREHLESLRAEAELIGASTLTREIATAQRGLSADATAAQREEVRELVTQMRLEETAVRTAVDEWGDYAAAVENAAEHRHRAGRAADSLIESLERELDLAGLGARDRFVEQRVGRLPELASDADVERVRELAGALFDARDGARAVREEADPIGDAYARVADGVHDGFTDAFESILRDGRIGFDGLADGILAAFRRTLAEMATLALARPVVVPIIQAVGGSLGLSQTALAGVSGSLGGGGAGLSSGLLGGLNRFGAARLGTGTGLPLPPEAYVGGAVPGQLTSATLSQLLGVGALGFGVSSLLGGGARANAFAGFGSAAGFALGGPLGAAAGGILGGALGGFGVGRSSYTRLGSGEFEIGTDEGAAARIRAVAGALERLVDTLDELGVVVPEVDLAIRSRDRNVLAIEGGARVTARGADPADVAAEFAAAILDAVDVSAEQLAAGQEGLALAESLRQQIDVQREYADAIGLTAAEQRAGAIAAIEAASGSAEFGERLRALNRELSVDEIASSLETRIEGLQRAVDTAGLTEAEIVLRDVDQAIAALGESGAGARDRIDPLVERFSSLTAELAELDAAAADAGAGIDAAAGQIAAAAADAARQAEQVEAIRAGLERQLAVASGISDRALALRDLDADLAGLGAPWGAAGARGRSSARWWGGFTISATPPRPRPLRPGRMLRARPRSQEPAPRKRQRPAPQPPQPPGSAPVSRGSGRRSNACAPPSTPRARGSDRSSMTSARSWARPASSASRSESSRGCSASTWCSSSDRCARSSGGWPTGRGASSASTICCPPSARSTWAPARSSAPGRSSTRHARRSPRRPRPQGAATWPRCATCPNSPAWRPSSPARCTRAGRPGRTRSRPSESSCAA